MTRTREEVLASFTNGSACCDFAQVLDTDAMAEHIVALEAKCAQLEADAALPPMQPIYMCEAGGRFSHAHPRFKGNAIVQHMQKTGVISLNDLAAMDFSAEDWMQLAQLLGYSVFGYGELSYVSDESYERAQAKAARTTTTAGA